MDLDVDLDHQLGRFLTLTTTHTRHSLASYDVDDIYGATYPPVPSFGLGRSLFPFFTYALFIVIQSSLRIHIPLCLSAYFGISSLFYEILVGIISRCTNCFLGPADLFIYVLVLHLPFRCTNNILPPVMDRMAPSRNTISGLPDVLTPDDGM